MEKAKSEPARPLHILEPGQVRLEAGWTSQGLLSKKSTVNRWRNCSGWEFPTVPSVSQQILGAKALAELGCDP